MPKVFLVILTWSLWMKPQRMCPTMWLGTYHKETETLWRMLWSNILEYESNSVYAYNAILSMGALKNRYTAAKAFVLLDAPSNIIRCSTLHSKSARIVILQKFLDSPPILCHNQRDKVIFYLIKGGFTWRDTQAVMRTMCIRGHEMRLI